MQQTKIKRGDLAKLAASSGLDVRTFSRWMAGEPIAEFSRLKIEKAYRELGIELPQRRTLAAMNDAEITSTPSLRLE